MNKLQQHTLQELKYAYSGAKMIEDEESMIRIKRAIAAFQADINMEIFTEEMIKSIYDVERSV